jgi:Tol biopolymer transport system component
MKRFWTAMAVILCAVGVLAGCNDYNNSVQYDTGATLTNLSPSGLPAQGMPTTGTIVQCPGTPNGQNNPCFTLYVIASATNPFSNATGVPLPVVRWNQKNLTTTFIDTTNVSAQVPYSYIVSPGTVAIDTYQPTGQGTGYNGISNALTFTVYGNPNPYPSLTSITPTSAAYCDSTSKTCAGIPITLNGISTPPAVGFIPTSQNGGSSVTFTGDATYGQETAITVNSISPTQLKATIPGTLLCATGIAQINVLNPPSAICLLNCPNLGGGDTNNPPSGQVATTQTFTITGTAGTNTCPANVPPGTTTTTAEKPAISQDGRYVAYASAENGTKQILLKDTCLGAATECVASSTTISVAEDGSAGNADSHSVSMTPDGRYLAFSSAATNLAQDAPTGAQVYVRDTCNGATASCKASTKLVSVDETGKLTGLAAVQPSISATGRFVAFVAETPGAVTGSASGARRSFAPTPSNGLRQIFVRDTCLAAANCTPKALRISVLPGSSATGSSNGTGLVAEEAPAISQDGRYVTYTGSQNGSWQILLTDTCVGVGKACAQATRTISSSADGSAGNAASHNAVMTADGRYIVFSSAATNLIENAPLGRQVYSRDTCAGTNDACTPATMLISTDAEGKLAGTEGILPSQSASGRYVAFLAVTASQAGSTAPNSGLRQVFVRDTCLAAANCTPQATLISLQPGDVPPGTVNPAGPALAGQAKQVALPDGKSSTLFTATIAVDDRVLVAIPGAGK